MRYSEIRGIARPPASHPHVTQARIDPADHRRLTRMIDERPELKVLGTDDRHADRWTVQVACASRRVRADFDDMVQNVF